MWNGRSTGILKVLLNGKGIIIFDNCFTISYAKLTVEEVTIFFGGITGLGYSATESFQTYNFKYIP